MESVGFFRENFTEHVLETYEIRLADINKDPFQKDGTLVLPIKPISGLSKYGLVLGKDAQGVPATGYDPSINEQQMVN